MAWQSFGKTTDMGLPTHKARFTPLEYQFAKEFYQERAAVKKHDKWGMIANQQSGNTHHLRPC